ncbi:hypothetical protein I3760_Q018400 [Carya illinoinensis]|nr:hypothetical protein I3760_Q018400 [Carya illinoinensis]
MAAVLLRLGFQIILLSCSVYAFAQAANIAKSPSCPEECGNNVKIPYPFGIGAGCYISKWFEIVCNESDSTFNGKPKPFLRMFKLEVLEILLPYGQVRVNYPAFTSCTNNASTTRKDELAGSPFVFSSNDNSFIAMGCNNSAVMWSEDKKVSPGAVCPFIHFKNRAKRSFRGDSWRMQVCILGRKFEAWGKFKIPTPNAYFALPVILDWGIDNPSETLLPNRPSDSSQDCISSSYPSFNRSRTYTCSCHDGFKGNPYLLEGCQDIDECANSHHNNCGNGTRCENTVGSYNCIPVHRSPRHAIIIGISTSLGLVVMLTGGWWSYVAVKKRKMIKQKEKFFKRNGGLLMLGQGGQGTVYKGMLLDGSIVAIKKSKIIDERKLDEFINEVVILSRINHRNVVKLLGCCLETEVPLLVYEFIPNGTLSQYLNNQNEEFPQHGRCAYKLP